METIQRFSDTEWSALCDRAYAIGEDHGKGAAGWWEQDSVGGRFTGDAKDAARHVLAGIEDGDPMVLDSFPRPDLSGQWADGYTPQSLVEDLDLEEFGDVEDGMMDLCEQYECGFSDAVHDAIEKACRLVLAD